MHSAELDMRLASSHDIPFAEYSHHSSAQRVNTDEVIVKAIEEQYPQKHVTISPEYGCDPLGYAAAGHALARPVTDSKERFSSKWRSYVPPAKRLDGATGGLADTVLFGKYQYAWKDHEFVLYLVDGRDGSGSYPTIRNNYLVGDEAAANKTYSGGW
jgi:transitional endoplasmic reticulum ATPase